MKLTKVFNRMTDWAAHISVISLFVLTICIFYGVVTRWFSLQDTYSFDISLYALVWFAMLSTGINARIGKHVTAGISVENYVKTRIPIFPLIRSLLVIAIMVIVFWAGLKQTYISFSSHQVTTSIAELPVWISLLSVALGSLSWIIGEAGRFVEMVVSSK